MCQTVLVVLVLYLSPARWTAASQQAVVLLFIVGFGQLSFFNPGLPFPDAATRLPVGNRHFVGLSTFPS